MTLGNTRSRTHSAQNGSNLRALIQVGIGRTQAQNERLFVRLSAASSTPAGGYACAIKGSPGHPLIKVPRSASPLRAA